MALLPAGGGLLPHLDVARNLDLGLRSAGLTQPGQLRRLARDFHVEGALDLLPHRLSGEQRLRVAAARALACGPAVLVVEDRRDQVPPAAAVQAAIRRSVAVLVLTDSHRRASAASRLVHRAVPADAAAPPDRAARPAADRDLLTGVSTDDGH